MYGRFVVTLSWCPLVRGEEGKDGRNIRVGQDGKQFNLSSDGLLVVLAFGEVRVVMVRIGYGFNGAV